MERLRIRGAVIGGTSVAAAILAQWAMHRLQSDVPFPPYGLGAWLIRETPGPFATEAIERLGHNAKDILAAGVIALVLVLGLVAGRSRWWTVALVAAFSVLAVVADPLRASFVDSAAAVAVGTVAAMWTWAAGKRAASGRRPHPADSIARRRFLVQSGATVVALAFAGSALAANRSRRASIAVAMAATPYREAPDPAFAAVHGLSARITPPGDHYVVDINFVPPRIDAGRWRLAIDGRVAAPRKLAYAELAALPTVEEPVFLQCISNVIGGGLMANSAWTCVPLLDVLAQAGMDIGARTIVAYGADGYSAAIPLADAGEVLVALAMGADALPVRHGSPVRLLWPGRYGMLSVKWLTRLEVVDDAPDGYWAERGWDREGRMETGARIDVPERAEKVAAEIVAAGVAWAASAVSRVEVSADNGESWREAMLESRAGPRAWTRWQVPVTVSGSRATIVARAYDDRGNVQVAESNSPHPGGATGLHRVIVDVDEG